MRIQVIAVGNRMPGWVNEACAEYARRIRGGWSLDFIEIAAGRRGKGADLPRVRRDEGRRQLAVVPADGRIVALARAGRVRTTRELASALSMWCADGAGIALLIGGPEGLSDEVLDAAHEVWSLSPMTLAHPVARVVLAEQLYRAYSIVQGLPYHRGP